MSPIARLEEVELAMERVGRDGVIAITSGNNATLPMKDLLLSSYSWSKGGQTVDTADAGIQIIRSGSVDLH